MMSEKFPNLGRDMDSQMDEAQKILGKQPKKLFELVNSEKL